MNRHLGLLVVISTLGSTSICDAQFGGALRSRAAEAERFGTPGEYGRLFDMKAVQKELAIKPDQLNDLERLLENAPSISKAEDKSATMSKYEVSLQKVLTPEQWKRCVELRIQKAGSAALVRDDVATKLNLSKDQQVKLGQLRVKAVSDAFSAGFKLGFRPDSPSAEEEKKAAAQRKARQQKSLQQGLSVLTEAQREQFKQLSGKPFSFSE